MARFPAELVNDLIPAVESTYPTYAGTTDALPTSPVFCAVVHWFAPPPFPFPIKNIDFTGSSHVFYGNALKTVRSFQTDSR